MARKPLLEKLTSQRAEMKAATDAGQTIVYGYLRAKDSGTAKAGTLYYVGIGSRHYRAFMPHARGGVASRSRDVPVPQDEVLIRCLGKFPERADAAAREVDLIKRYGRKFIEDQGVLLNRSTGGEVGMAGIKKTAVQRRRLSAALKAIGHRPVAALAAREERAAEKLGVSLEMFQGMTRPEKLRMMEWVRNHPGKTGIDYLSISVAECREAARLKVMEKGARKYGVSYDLWITLSTKARKNAAKRYGRGKRGAALLEGLI